MRLPRRVPWTSTAELDQLCSWIFTDENDLESKVKAINRLSAWRAITALPHALESTLALLSALMQDASDARPSSYLSLRHSYATAIIRLVNGLVDPLQLGAYARSIASIANQLGLPPWLVELRHAATHEDLPSLELLRQAARESMTWLLHNYFLPTINPSTVAPPQSPPLRPLAPVLKQYKSLRKIVTRDASLKSQYQQETKTVFKDIERWIAEATVSANVAVGELGWSTSGKGDQSAKERWALERLCDALMEKGALVPLSKKKRVFPAESFSPPKFSVELWSSLLSDLTALHSDFPSVLSGRIVSHLLAEPPATRHGPDHRRHNLRRMPRPLGNMGYRQLGCRELGHRPRLETGHHHIANNRFGPKLQFEQEHRSVLNFATALLQALCAGDPEMDAALSILLPPQAGSLVREWNSDDISVMNERLATLLAPPESHVEVRPTHPNGVEMSDVDFAPGWRLLDASSNWKACPIGVYVA
ncbi:Protein LAS1 [Mycena sanguinolenta]|uniref:Protein LAS1 n=1 Tax=Mycena sanguinolenta TaxID=230812 RepID=A0A8H6YU60_9AGAR|nr:Protein LAS1 [Mycena sanguinolenta]